MDQFLHDDVDIYLIQHQNDYEEARKHSFSLEKSNDAMLTYKTKMNSQANKASVKGKYIDKLKKIASNNQTYEVNQLEQGCSIQSLSKKQRNRISAKQSRDRKKLYIQLMEYEQKKLQKQLQEVGKQIQQTKSKINRFCSSNKSTAGFAARNQLEGKLAKILEDTQSNNMEEQINILLDSISFRIGATGRQRVQKQNQHYKQIINLSLPPLHRYLMWAATQNVHLFNPTKNQSKPSQPQQFVCQLMKSIQNMQNYEQVTTSFQSVRDEIVQRKQNLIQLVTRLWQIKGRIEQQLKKLQNQVDNMRQILSPVQSAKFILFASLNKYRKDLNFFPQDKECKELQYEQEIEKLSKPSKKVKKQEQY